MTIKLTDELKKALRDEFVRGYTDDQGVLRFPTVDGLVKRYNVARATLYRCSSDEDWQGQKNKYQTELTQREDAESIRRMVQKMKRYVLPPQFDFINFDQVDPMVMYFFEFKYEFEFGVDFEIRFEFGFGFGIGIGF